MTKHAHSVTMHTGGVPIYAFANGVKIEDAAWEQTIQLSKMPFIHRHLALMPDAHKGIGSTVGTVIPTKGAIIPAAVGVDIGCGMMAAKLNLLASDLPDTLRHIRGMIEAVVPHGRTNNGKPGDRGAWGEPTPDAEEIWFSGMAQGLNDLVERHPKIKTHTNPILHLGTLGGGNHFIELCLDENQNVWLMLHSGSRGIGNRIGSYFIDKAKEEMRRYFIDQHLENQDNAYLVEHTEIFADYMAAVTWAQDFALTNRRLMMKAAIAALRKLFVNVQVIDTAVECHHNYVAIESHYGENVFVTRKGAVRAREGDLGIIPGSMGAKSFIVRGKGNPYSLHSCSHGAGRSMSRTEARKTFTVEDHATATAGVECRKDADVIDETPAAYKDIDAVMAAQAANVEIVHTLKQVLCVKG